LKDPLFAIGTIVSLINDDFQKSLQEVLIIGKRGCVEGVAYDYIGVNLSTGFVQADEKSLLFFNTTEIQEIKPPIFPEIPLPEQPDEGSNTF
jgi:hypothetical protein